MFLGTDTDKCDLSLGKAARQICNFYDTISPKKTQIEQTKYYPKELNNLSLLQGKI